MSPPTTRVRFLFVEEFETRTVPALLSLSLPSLAVPGLSGLLRTIENIAPGLIESVTPPEPAPAPGGGVTPSLPTLPDVDVPDVGTAPPPVGSGEPVAGPDVFTPSVPVLTPPTTSAPVADAPAATTAGPPTTTTTPTSGTVSFAPDDADAPVAFAPTTPVGVEARATVEAAPSSTSAPASAAGMFVPEASSPAAIFAGPAALMGVPVDPATVADTPPEVLPPGVEVAPVASVTVTAPSPGAVVADAALPEAVATAEPEAIDLASWGWSAVVAVVAAGGYWLARRYHLARKVAEVLFPAKLAVPV